MFEHTDSIVQVEIRVEVDLTARRNSLVAVQERDDFVKVSELEAYPTV